MATSKIEKLFAKLSTEEVTALRELVAEQIRAQVAEKVDMQVEGQLSVYNRSEDDFEFQVNSKPHIIGANKIASLPVDIAQFAIKKSAFKNIGRANVMKWLVPYGDPNFGIPLSKKDAGLTGDPVNDYPLPLGPSKYDHPATLTKGSKFSFDELPPRGPDEPPIQHRPGLSSDAEVQARPDSL